MDGWMEGRKGMGSVTVWIDVIESTRLSFWAQYCSMFLKAYADFLYPGPFHFHFISFRPRFLVFRRWVGWSSEAERRCSFTVINGDMT